MRVAILTSSRADYGIYRPLLKSLMEEPDISPELIVFGTHLSKYHGYTIKEIEKDGYPIYDQIESLGVGDSPAGVSTSFSLTSLKFTEFWRKNQDRYNLVFCLGDRFEMCAAVYAAIPFNIRFAHLHGGETTLGAIDNIYRHAISLAATLHFVALDENGERLKRLLASDENIYKVGSLSLDNLRLEPFMSNIEFEEAFGIDLTIPSVLVTFHPETKSDDDNSFIRAVASAISELLKKWQVIITMPNADTHGTRIRDCYKQFEANRNFKIVENFGTRGYFTCMQNVEFVVGNSSSGIIEAASFGKYVLNIGTRQQGRAVSQNVINAGLNPEEIVDCINQVSKAGRFEGENVYGDGLTAPRVITIIKKERDV